MSLLHSLKAVRKSLRAEYHEDRVRVLAEIPPDLTLEFLKKKAEKANPAWLLTLTRIGMLDLGDMVKDGTKKSDLEATVGAWCEHVNAMLDFMGAPKTKTDPNGIGNTKSRTYTVFEASAATKPIFYEATQALIAQAERWKELGIKLPTLDSKESMSGALVETLARWAGTACMIDSPNSLKLLIDTWPGAMACAIPVDCKLGKVAGAHADSTIAQTAHGAASRISPFYCALQVGSAACIDEILKKRQELGLPRDPAYASSVATEFNSGMIRPATFTESFVYADSVARPESLIGALKAVVQDDESWMAQVASRINTYVIKKPDYLLPAIEQGMYESACSSTRAQAIKRAMTINSPGLPRLLQNVPWDEFEHQLDNRNSIFMRMAEGAKDELKTHEAGLLAFVQQIKADGKQDVFFQTYPDRPALSSPARLEPLSTLSKVGMTPVIFEFMDHGFDPMAKDVHPVTWSLVETVQKEGHGTEAELLAYHARKHANQLIGLLQSVHAKP